MGKQKKSGNKTDPTKVIVLVTAILNLIKIIMELIKSLME